MTLRSCVKSTLLQNHLISFQAEATCRAAAEQLELELSMRLPSMDCQQSIIQGLAVASETYTHNVCTRMRAVVDTLGALRLRRGWTHKRL